MKEPLDQLYAERLHRYVTAMRNGMPDRVPIRPFAAEITARYAGYTCQDVTHDYNKAFEAVIKCCRDFDWDAVVPNMVYVWTGLTQAIGLRYYGIPGIDVRSRRGLSVSRARRAGGLHEAGGVRRADRRPDPLPLRDLAAPGLDRDQSPRASPRRCGTTSRSSRAGCRCSATSTLSARRSNGCGASAARSRRSAAC